MICCDTCEDWFHGKCVGITKAQGKAMELKNISWICPLCKKKEAEKRKNARAAERTSHIARRSGDTVKLSKSAAAQQAEAAAAAVASKTAFTPEKTSTYAKSSLKRSDSRTTEKVENEDGRCCSMVKFSIQCLTICVYYTDKEKIESTASNPVATSPSKLKVRSIYFYSWLLQPIVLVNECLC